MPARDGDGVETESGEIESAASAPRPGSATLGRGDSKAGKKMATTKFRDVEKAARPEGMPHATLFF
jgi:hypothetical protein